MAVGIVLLSVSVGCGGGEADLPDGTTAIGEESNVFGESSEGESRPRVPLVVGRSESKAVRWLERAGFRVTVKTKTRTSGKDGVVLRQVPHGKDLAKPGSTVTVVVSSVIRPIAQPSQNCTPGYKPCLPPASDYDCAGGSGDGPEYASGPIYVSGSDPYDLDSEGDGVACESY